MIWDLGFGIWDWVQLALDFGLSLPSKGWKEFRADVRAKALTTNRYLVCSKDFSPESDRENIARINSIWDSNRYPLILLNPYYLI